MKFMGDYHMHTAYSDGRGTVEEMAVAARRRHLSAIGVAEHGPRSIGTGVKNEKSYLEIKAKLQALQPSFPDIRFLTGAEANVIHPGGRLDITKDTIQRLDYLLVGLHPFVLPQGWEGWDWMLENQAGKVFSFLDRRVRNTNTKALKEAIYSYDVWAVSHPGLGMPIEIAELAKACQAKDTAWEINAGHCFPSCREVLEAARYGVEFVVNSDAHFPETVGDLSYGSWVLEKAGVPAERVRNAKMRAFKE